MNLQHIFMVLSNKHKANILEWLKAPYKHFESVASSEDAKQALKNEFGVCVGLIQKKCGLSQPTVSMYLKEMEKAGLLMSERKKMWTHYARNEANIKKIKKLIYEFL